MTLGTHHIGYVTLRLPIVAVTEQESWEIPQEYTYLDVEKPELISHDIPEQWREAVREVVRESDIDTSELTEEQFIETATTPENPGALPTEIKNLLNFHESEARLSKKSISPDEIKGLFGSLRVRHVSDNFAEGVRAALAQEPDLIVYSDGTLAPYPKEQSLVTRTLNEAMREEPIGYLNPDGTMTPHPKA